MNKAADNWISVDDRLPLHNNEVEIAFWDGCYMCRAFGIFEYGEWMSCGDEIEEDRQFRVTHWREATPLPPPPTDKPEHTGE